MAVGDHVETGELIAQIDSLDQENAVARAEAALAQVEAQIAASRPRWKRLKSC
ncbi:MAG: biotin/lipoyl-binding protein [Exiguobacterium profundum]|nr:MAG: biotin/lipoyl-binding protein [Exiguobacterium profundum]